jgi:hypothetical protein
MLSKPFIAFLEDRRAGWVILLAALVVRLAVLFLVADAPLVSDAAGYFGEAGSLAGGVDYTPKWPPGLPLYLSVFRHLSTGEFIARASMLLWFLALALVGYGLVLDAAREEKWTEAGKRSAQFGANLFLVAFAVFPCYILNSVDTLTQLPAAVGVMASAWLTLRLVRGAGTGTAVLLGCVLGFTALIRPTALLLIPAVPVYLAVRLKKPLPPLAVLLPAAGVVGLWLLVAWNMTGYFVFVNEANTWNLFLGNNPYTPLYRTWWLGSHAGGESGWPAGFSRLVGEINKLPAHLRSGRYAELAWGEIIGRPDLFTVRCLSRVQTYLALDSYTGSYLVKIFGLPLWVGLLAIAADGALYVGLVGAAILALFAGKKALPDKDALTVLLGISLLYALPYFVSFSHPTFHIPTTPLLAVIAAVFAGRLRRGDGVWEKLKSSKKRRVWLWVVAALFAAVQIEWLVVMAGVM